MTWNSRRRWPVSYIIPDVVLDLFDSDESLGDVHQHHTFNIMVSPYTAGRIPLTATGQIPSVLQPSEPDSTNGSPELPDMTSIAPLPRTRISTTPPASPPRGSSVPYTNGKSPGTGLLPQRSGLMESPQIPQGSAIADVAEVPEAGPSSAPVRRVYPKKPKVRLSGVDGHHRGDPQLIFCRRRWRSCSNTPLPLRLDCELDRSRPRPRRVADDLASTSRTRLESS